MNFIKKFMIKYPLLSIFIISPFTFFFISSLFDIILHFLLPFLISLWISSWVYTTIIGDPWRRNLTDPFWFIHWRNNPR